MNRQDYLSGMFRGADQRRSFQSQDQIFNSVRLTAAPTPQPFPVGELINLPETYQYEGATCDLKTFLDDTDTMALVVLKDGKLRYESYAEWGGRDTPWLSADGTGRLRHA